MGIPFTNNLMPVVHILPVNTVTRQFIKLDEVIPNSTSSDYFDFGSNFHFLNLSLNSDGQEVTLEFVDPTFKNFERVLSLVNRKVFSPYIGNICFSCRIGWVAGGSTTERDILYPKQRDSSLRVGGSLNQTGKLIMIGKEILSEPFIVRVTEMQYSVQGTGIKYTMKGAFNWHFEEALYSQSDEVMPKDCSYLTLLYRVAAKMKVLIRFDESVDPMLLARAGSLKFSFDNKKNIDNFARILEEINSQEKDGIPPLQVSISASYEDAKAALKQITSLYGGAVKKDDAVDSDRIRMQGYDKIYTGINIVQAIGGVIFAGTPIIPLVPILENQQRNKAQLNELIANEDEMKRLQDSLREIMTHWNRIKDNSKIQDWKTYVISKVPNPNGYGSSEKNRGHFDGMKFLGIYTNFGKDLEDIIPTANGIDTTMSTLLMTSLNIDESIIRISQVKSYKQVIEHTGEMRDHLLDMYKETYKTPGAIQKLSQQLNLVLPKEEDEKVQNNVNSLKNTNNLTSNIASNIFGIGSVNFGNAFLNAIRGNAAGAEQIATQAAATQNNLLTELRDYFKLSSDATIDQIGMASDSKYNEIMNNPYIKDSCIPPMLIQNVDVPVDRVVASLNPTDKRVKVIKQVTKLRMAEAMLEAMKRGAFDVAYNREAIVLTLRVIGDIGITTDLIGNSVLFLKFFNPNGTTNDFITGYYRLTNFRHDISSNAVFTTEISLLAHDFKGSGSTAADVSFGGGATGGSGAGGGWDESIPGIDMSSYPTDLQSSYRSYTNNIGKLSWIQDGDSISAVQGFVKNTGTGDITTYSIGDGAVGSNVPVGAIDTATKEVQQ